MIAGVCGGIAQWGSWNPVWVRVIFVVGSILPILPGFLVYLLLWLVVPSEAAAGAATRSGTSSRPGRAASRASAGR
jgi:phage shock protein C